MKASEKQGLCKKIVTVLKKRYKSSPPSTDRPVLDLLLHAICLENVSQKEADATYQRLHEEFHDYNEMRVSSLTELEGVFEGYEEPEYRALRVRTALQDIFEKYYTFDFDVLRKKTLDTATKQMAKLRHLTDFVRDYTLQTALDAHLVPLDDRMRDASVWLGLVEPDATPSEAGESLKPALRKADAPKFCQLLRCLATDPAFAKTFGSAHKKPPEEGFDPEDAVDRLEDLLKAGGKSTRKKSSTKSAARKTASKSKTAKKTGTKRKAKKAAKSKTKKKTKRTARHRK